jgi:hypothetical protein
MNILCVGGRTVGPEVAWDRVQTLLTAELSSPRLSCVASARWPRWNQKRKLYDDDKMIQVAVWHSRKSRLKKKDMIAKQKM